MTKFKISLLLIVATFFSFSSFSQVSLQVNKPLSEQDMAEVESILKSFDASSYNMDLKSERGSLKRGLASVKQVETTRPARLETAAKTNTNINIFKTASAASNTNINIFSSTAAKTNTNINIFKPANYTTDQLSQLDKLHQILSKYQ